jgi:hypothetical protein
MYTKATNKALKSDKKQLAFLPLKVALGAKAKLLVYGLKASPFFPNGSYNERPDPLHSKQFNLQADH